MCRSSVTMAISRGFPEALTKAKSGEDSTNMYIHLLRYQLNSSLKRESWTHGENVCSHVTDLWTHPFEFQEMIYNLRAGGLSFLDKGSITKIGVLDPLYRCVKVIGHLVNKPLERFRFSHESISSSRVSALSFSIENLPIFLERPLNYVIFIYYLFVIFFQKPAN